MKKRCNRDWVGNPGVSDGDNCVREAGHEGKHRCKHGFEWYGGSMYPLPEAIERGHKGNNN
jgi:hypothetical protein